MPPNNCLYGNYAKYYGYRRTNCYQDEDSRCNLFKSDWFRAKRLLDIGCNDGSLTIELAVKYQTRSVVGIDKDASIIQTAKKNLYLRKASILRMISLCNNRKEESYLKNVLKKLLCVQFIHGDWAQFDCGIQLGSIDIVLALSITKWFHINNGDLGLRCFMRRLYAVLKQEGLIILEPQYWSSYDKATQKIRSRETNHRSSKLLQSRPMEFSSLFEKSGSFIGEISVKIARRGKIVKGFDRDIWLYKKNSIKTKIKYVADPLKLAN